MDNYVDDQNLPRYRPIAPLTALRAARHPLLRVAGILPGRDPPVRTRTIQIPAEARETVKTGGENARRQVSGVITDLYDAWPTTIISTGDAGQ